MSKSKQNLEQSPISEALPVPGLSPLPSGFPGHVSDAEKPVASEIGPIRVFRDKAYSSRTLIMPDGRTLAVVNGLVMACGDDQYEFLSAHPELEQTLE